MYSWYLDLTTVVIGRDKMTKKVKVERKKLELLSMLPRRDFSVHRKSHFSFLSRLL